MYKAMKTLISRKFYKDGNTAQDILNVFYSVLRLTNDEYLELTTLVKDIYGE